MRSRRSGCTLEEFLVMLCAFEGIVTGMLWGGQFGSRHASVGTILGGIGGGVGGFVLGLFGGIGLLDSLDKRRIERKPAPPICENGCCATIEDYEMCELPAFALRSLKGLFNGDTGVAAGIFMRPDTTLALRIAGSASCRTVRSARI